MLPLLKRGIGKVEGSIKPEESGMVDRHDVHVESWRHHLIAHIDGETALAPTAGCHEYVPSEIGGFYKSLEAYFDLIYRMLWDTVHPIDAVSHSDTHKLMRAFRDPMVMADLLGRDVTAYDALQRQSRFGRK